MTTLAQRLTVSALIEHLDSEMREGRITPTLNLQLLIAKTRSAFTEYPDLRVGDHAPEPANYTAVQDAVQSAMSEEQ